MATIGVRTRLVRLELLLRVRGCGYWPWLALAGWSLFAAGQEPTLLRSYGIHIGWQATWSGAAILLIALASSGPSSGMSGAAGSGNTGYGAIGLRGAVSERVAVGVLLAALVGALQALLAMAAEFVAGNGLSPAAAAASAAGFTAALAPASIGCVLLVPLWAGSMIARIGLGLVVVFSLSLSAVWFSHPRPGAAGASVLVAAGAVGCALLASSASVTRTLTPHANRHPG